jgi:hypothetical protein
MILLLVFLFIREPGTFFVHFKVFRPLHGLLIALCIAPVLLFFGTWREELSFKMYPGDTPYLYICLQGTALQRSDELQLQPYRSRLPVCEGEMLSVKAWVMDEMHVMPHSDAAYLHKLREALAQQGFDREETTFWMHHAPYDEQAMIRY